LLIVVVTLVFFIFALASPPLPVRPSVVYIIAVPVLALRLVQTQSKRHGTAA
jgi:hypothetical protein